MSHSRDDKNNAQAADRNTPLPLQLRAEPCLQLVKVYPDYELRALVHRLAVLMRDNCDRLGYFERHEANAIMSDIEKLQEGST
jgi:hypothetical protein